MIKRPNVELRTCFAFVCDECGLDNKVDVVRTAKADGETAEMREKFYEQLREDETEAYHEMVERGELDPEESTLESYLEFVMEHSQILFTAVDLPPPGVTCVGCKTEHDVANPSDGIQVMDIERLQRFAQKYDDEMEDDEDDEDEDDESDW